ncbi:hypothetical protein [Flavobacterium eburneipallidum]|uniref:hypothetical protein n=1 Tax=Flavobacterium eburneipallidum TaxID=3003263 RepID=UPI0022ABD740|nr:hypothetical protein [Flavobacterium eburneipallidum]
MKKLCMACLFLISIGFVSCKNEEKQKPKEAIEKPISVSCYEAIYENDTINLTVNLLKDGKASGNMVMKMADMPEKIGEIKGEFRGDTLFADYSFIEANNDKKQFKNPIAVLKRDSLFILGNGKIETYLGASYFAKGVPIDFDNVKYQFKTVDCTAK